MPEGPSIVILKELLLPYKHLKIESVSGNAKIDLKLLHHKKIIDIKSWGKQLIICFKGFYIRIHLLMFGTYRINERKETKPRLSMKLKADEINFYNCSIKLIAGDVSKDYDWQTDVMADEWKPLKAEKKLKELKCTQIADALLNQEIFSGVGNIIKNEILFRAKVHPESIVEVIPIKKLKELVTDARAYSFDFYEWKKRFELRKHWLIYTKSICPKCKTRVKREYLGKGRRISYYCINCQVLYQK
ncbi:MAG TPA: endonuclease [Bacteroidia bacterium]|nr:endonuclease [Bacteroidia bacterium]